MEAIVFFFLSLMLVLPVTALILAILAYRGNTASAKRLDSLNHLLDETRQDQIRLSRRLSELEQTGGARVAAKPEEPLAEPEKAEELEIEEIELEELPLSTPPPPAEATPRAAPPATAPPSPVQPQTVQPSPPTTPTGQGLERQFGTRVAVWLGAIALALAGGFLVKYSVERGLIGPTTRIVLGLLFGLSLLGVGEWIAKRYAGLAQGLEAAGIAVLYAVLLAGFRLYDLYPATVAFLGMLLTTATAVVLSLRRGQGIAVLGLLGGFLTPLLIGSTEPRPWMLLIYLAMIQGGLLVVSRKMRWWPIAGLTLVGAMGWALLWMSDLAGVGGGTLHVALLLTVSSLGFVFFAGSPSSSDQWGDARVPRVIVWGSMGLGTVLLAALVGVGEFGLMEWTFFGLIGAGCIVLGRIEPTYEGLGWVASLAGASLLWLWGFDLGMAAQSDLSRSHVLLWRVGLALAVVFVGGSYRSLWGSVRPSRWAALASVSGTVYLLAAYGGLHEQAYPIPWGLQALLTAAVFVGLSVPVARRRDTLHEGSTALAVLAVAVTTHVSLAVPMELERAWITVAWAIEIPALAWIAARLRVPELGKLAWVMGGLVTARLLLNPAVLDYPIGDGVLFNWLLYGYGLPIAAFVAGAILFRRGGSGKLADALEIGAIILGFAYITLAVRQYFHPGDLIAADVMLAEWGAWVVLWLVYAVGLSSLYGATRRKLHLVLGVAVGLFAIAVSVLVTGIAQNPLWASLQVGETTIFNRVLWVYGVPSILAVIFARMLRRRNLRVPSWISGSAALLLGFLTLTLEVRQAFHGSLLRGGETSNAEMYTYSLVWVLFAIGLLVAGIVTRGTVVRYGSSVVMLVAVGKVFLVDTAQLEDLYRVFSLFGLGVTLMVLAWIYQRFVFREPRP